MRARRAADRAAGGHRLAGPWRDGPAGSDVTPWRLGRPAAGRPTDTGRGTRRRRPWGSGAGGNPSRARDGQPLGTPSRPGPVGRHPVHGRHRHAPRRTASPACAALAARALETTVTRLSARFGPDPARWRWDDAHRARFEHPLLRFVPVIGDWLRIEVPTPGDGETVNRGGLARDLSHVHGPGLRIVMDLGARPDSPDAVAAIIATGQSGHPFSRHWRDLNADWAAARLLPLAPRANAAARLRLDP
ncbi:penicillin acylase family protein [Roseomonas sp. CCTCC AB2023176]|uniref:penicillin acylase family protein n=1 Tax=Roseomonas sp. CCTCC AB2023176 TaxID=3342640 RepID=UPI0035D9C1DD